MRAQASLLLATRPIRRLGKSDIHPPLPIFANRPILPFMATRNINLTDALDRFVAEQVESGQFQNASEVVRAGLRALKADQVAHAAKVEALRAAIQEGTDSGPAIPIEDIGAWLDEIDAEVEAELAAEAAAAHTSAE